MNVGKLLRLFFEQFDNPPEQVQRLRVEFDGSLAGCYDAGVRIPRCALLLGGAHRFVFGAHAASLPVVMAAASIASTSLSLYRTRRRPRRTGCKSFRLATVCAQQFHRRASCRRVRRPTRISWPVVERPACGWSVW